MTSPTSSEQSPAVQDDAEANTTPQQPAFKFPFSSAEALAAKNARQPWHMKGINPQHEKRIGMPPRGTRRSMGKR